MCAILAGPLQAFEAATCEVFSLFLEHSVAEWGRGDSGWAELKGRMPVQILKRWIFNLVQLYFHKKVDTYLFMFGWVSVL